MKRLPLIVYIWMSILLLVTTTISVSYFMKAVNLEVDARIASNDNKKKIHLVLISQELDNPYWRQIEHGAKVAAEKNGTILEYLGPIVADPAEQLKFVEVAIASKIDGILTQGLKDSHYIEVINNAIDRKIPVITIDSDSSNSNRLAYVGTDNYAAGLMAGKELISVTGASAKVGIVTGLFNAPNLSERVRGILDAVKNEQNIRILDVKESKIDRVGAATAAYNLISEYPELDTLIGTSALDAIGFVQMLDNARENNDPILKNNERIKIIAFDDLQETMEYIEQGKIDATIVQKPYQMGYASVELMLDYLQGSNIVTMYNTDISVLKSANMSRVEDNQ